MTISLITTPICWHGTEAELFGNVVVSDRFMHAGIHCADIKCAGMATVAISNYLRQNGQNIT